MTRHSAARLAAVVAVGLLLASAILQIGYYGSVIAHVTDDFRPIISTVWFGSVVNLVVVAALVLTIRSVGVARGRLALVLLAVNPLALAALQLLYHAPWPPPVALLLAGLGLLLDAQLGSATQESSTPAA